VTTAQRRNRRTAAVTAATVVVAFFVGAGVLNVDDTDRTVAPASPPDDGGAVWGPAQVPLHEMGQTDTSSDGQIDTTVLDFADPFVSGGDTSPPAATRWAGLELETCLPRGGFTISASAEDWELVDAEGNHLPAAKYTRQDVLPQDSYPRFGESVDDYECVRGWALWALPANFTPVTALHNHPTAAWTLAETP